MEWKWCKRMRWVYQRKKNKEWTLYIYIDFFRHECAKFIEAKINISACQTCWRIVYYNIRVDVLYICSWLACSYIRIVQKSKSEFDCVFQCVRALQDTESISKICDKFTRSLSTSVRNKTRVFLMWKFFAKKTCSNDI